MAREHLRLLHVGKVGQDAALLGLNRLASTRRGLLAIQCGTRRRLRIPLDIGQPHLPLVGRAGAVSLLGVRGLDHEVRRRGGRGPHAIKLIVRVRGHHGLGAVLRPLVCTCAVR